MPPKPLSFAEPRGAPGGYETATLTGVTQGNVNPENLAAANGYASCDKAYEAGIDSGNPIVDYSRGYRPRTVYSQGLPQVHHFTGGDDRSFLEWFSMLKRAIPDFQDIHDGQRWNHVASRLKNPALAYWLTIEEFSKSTFDEAIEEMGRIYHDHMDCATRMKIMMDMRIKKGQSVRDYLTYKLAYMRRKTNAYDIDKVCGDRFAVNALFNGLPPYLKPPLIRFRTAGTVEELVEAAISLDVAMQGAREETANKRNNRQNQNFQRNDNGRFASQNQQRRNGNQYQQPSFQNQNQQQQYSNGNQQQNQNWNRNSNSNFSGRGFQRRPQGEENFSAAVPINAAEGQTTPKNNERAQGLTPAGVAEVFLDLDKPIVVRIRDGIRYVRLGGRNVAAAQFRSLCFIFGRCYHCGGEHQMAACPRKDDPIFPHHPGWDRKQMNENSLHQTSDRSRKSGKQAYDHPVYLYYDGDEESDEDSSEQEEEEDNLPEGNACYNEEVFSCELATLEAVSVTSTVIENRPDKLPVSVSNTPNDGTKEDNLGPFRAGEKSVESVTKISSIPPPTVPQVDGSGKETADETVEAIVQATGTSVEPAAPIFEAADESITSRGEHEGLTETSADYLSRVLLVGAIPSGSPELRPETSQARDPVFKDVYPEPVLLDSTHSRQFIQLQANGKTVVGLPDTGATVNFMPKALYDRDFSHLPLRQKGDYQILGVTSHDRDRGADTAGLVRLHMHFHGKTLNANFLVGESHDPYTLILGQAWQDSMLLNVGYDLRGNRVVYMDNRIVPSYILRHGQLEEVPTTERPTTVAREPQRAISKRLFRPPAPGVPDLGLKMSPVRNREARGSELLRSRPRIHRTGWNGFARDQMDQGQGLDAREYAGRPGC